MLGCVGLQKLWVGLSWVMKNGPMSMSELTYIYRVGQKMAQFFVYLITSPNINRFLKSFHCQNHETICNKTVTTDPTTPQMCRYTTS